MQDRCKLIDLLGSITRLAVHAVPYRRGERFDYIIDPVGERIGCRSRGLGEDERKTLRVRKRSQGGI